ncbi:hypothetical protein Syun_012381 [Stephania yunnanensis]|uniref:Uncharacterized protein n=1 Tax=Stephania yunnanensis TaxID=152371 RepID=A0AAP0JZJ0_9MAGN
MSQDARNQTEERLRFCNSHGGRALGDPDDHAEESIRQTIRETEECGSEN